MEITERFDVQYYKNIIKEKNTYENATSAQYVERNGTEVYVSFNEDGYFLQEIKPFTYEMIVKNYYKKLYSQIQREIALSFKYQNWHLVRI